MSLFTQIVILLIILSSMVMVLLAIRQLAHFDSFDDSEETHNLREELQDDNHIITGNSIFGTLIDADPEEKISKNHYKENSKEPISRKE